MNGTQMMLVLGAVVLLSLLVLNLGSSMLYSDDQMSQNEYTMAATTVAQTMLAEIGTKAFDFATVSDEFADPSTFTSPGGLGHGSWETYPNFNDVDDYNRLSTTMSTPRAGDFDVYCRVEYVDPANPDNPVSVRTRTKRVRVTVSSQLLAQPVTLIQYKSH